MDVRSLALSAARSMLVSGAALYAVAAIIAPHPGQAADAADLAVGSPHVTPAQPSVNPTIDKIDDGIGGGDVPIRPGAPPLPGRPADLAAPSPALPPPPALSPLPTENVATKIVHMPREDPGPSVREPNAAHTLVAPQGAVEAVADEAAADGGRRPLPGVPADTAVDAADEHLEHVMEAPVAEADAAHNAAALRAIAKLQRALPAHGYHVGPPSGRLDTETKLAILQYQHDAGLDADAYSAVSLEKTVDSVYYAAPPFMAVDPSSATDPAAAVAAADDAASPGPVTASDKAKAATLASAWAHAFSPAAASPAAASPAAASPAAEAAPADTEVASAAALANTPTANTPTATSAADTSNGNTKSAALVDAMATLYRNEGVVPQSANSGGDTPAGETPTGDTQVIDTPAPAPQVSDTPAREQIAEMPETAVPETAAPEAGVAEVAVRSRPAAQPAVVSAAPIDNDIASRAVAWVQGRLDLKGYDAGPANGHMGNYTADAIADFQVANGMKPTGQIDGPLLDLLSRQ